MPDTFPYDPDWQRPGVADKRILKSTSVSGASKSRIKATTKRAFELRFEARDLAEFTAALAFWDARYPGTTFLYNDKTVSPAVDITMEFTSPLQWTAISYNDYDYWFTCAEV